MCSTPARYRLTVNATLAEWVAHFQESSLQNYFCDFFTRITPRAASFSSCVSDSTVGGTPRGTRMGVVAPAKGSPRPAGYLRACHPATEIAGAIAYRAVVVARLAMRPL